MSKLRTCVPFSKIHSGSVYIHWPYCSKRCSYCNFNKYILSSDKTRGHKKGTPPWIVPEKRMVNGLVSELHSLLTMSGIEEVVSVYFGGGTPSLMDPKSINFILEELSGRISSSNNVEVTLEANPEDLIPSQSNKLEQLKDAGINRLSLGIQAFNEKDLREMNRAHSLQDSFEVIQNCIRVFGETALSLDLIFGRNRSQSLDSWFRELDIALGYGVGHLSLYQLTVERGTPLWKDRETGLSVPPEEELVSELYIQSVQKLKESGYHRYEVSNFAKSPSTQSRHNSHYWEGGEYIGIGPGAHGRFVVRSDEVKGHSKSARNIIQGKSDDCGSVGRQERVQTLEPHEWVREVELVGHGTRRVNPLSDLDSCIELLGSGLRTSKGVQTDKWRQVCSVSLEDLVTYSHDTRRMAREGYLICSSESLFLSEDGMNVTDHIAASIVSNLINLQTDL